MYRTKITIQRPQGCALEVAEYHSAKWHGLLLLRTNKILDRIPDQVKRSAIKFFETARDISKPLIVLGHKITIKRDRVNCNCEGYSFPHDPYSGRCHLRMKDKVCVDCGVIDYYDAFIRDEDTISGLNTCPECHSTYILETNDHGNRDHILSQLYYGEWK